jgi:hypothetical protein
MMPFSILVTAYGYDFEVTGRFTPPFRGRDADDPGDIELHDCVLSNTATDIWPLLHNDAQEAVIQAAFNHMTQRAKGYAT